MIVPRRRSDRRAVRRLRPDAAGHVGPAVTYWIVVQIVAAGCVVRWMVTRWGAVVGEQRLGIPVDEPGGSEAVHHVGGLHRGERRGDEQEAGVVVQADKDLDITAVGELPVRGVGLPELAGQLGLEANEGGARPLVRLRRDQPVAFWRMRQTVATEGAVPTSRRRWCAMVCGPLSWPAAARSQRRRTMAAWTSTPTAWRRSGDGANGTPVRQSRQRGSARSAGRASTGRCPEHGRPP